MYREAEMYKITQVQLKIEELFFKEILYRFGEYSLIGSGSIKENINKIFCERTNNLNDNNIHHITRRELKSGETRQSIIQSLYDLQKSLLPDGFKFINENEIIDSWPDATKPLRMVGSITFYDPESRIITLTRFDKEEDV